MNFRFTFTKNVYKKLLLSLKYLVWSVKKEMVEQMIFFSYYNNIFVKYDFLPVEIKK